jgi:ribosomal protein L16/L10AE
MIKLPANTKNKRNHRHHIKNFYIKIPPLNKKNLESQNNVVSLISLQKAYLTLPLILNLKVFIRKYFKKKVKITIPLLVNYHFTQKGLGVRMGKGKGKPVSWFIGVTLGSVIFQIFVNKKDFFKIRLCLYYVCKKLPIYTRIRLYEKTFEKTYCE